MDRGGTLWRLIELMEAGSPHTVYVCGRIPKYVCDRTPGAWSLPNLWLYAKRLFSICASSTAVDA